MKRLISLLCAALFMFTLLSGCDRTDGTEASHTQPTEPTREPTVAVEEVELTLPGDDRPYLGVELEFLAALGADDPRVTVLEQAAEVFEIRTGGKVNFYWLDGDENVLASNLSGGIRVDIFAASVDALGELFGAYALDLTDYAESCGYADRSHQVLRDQITERCGFLAAIPQSPVLYGMYYNVQTLEEAGGLMLPDSWEQLLTFSEELVRNGFMPMAMDIENCHIALELLLERQYGYGQVKTLMEESGWTREAEHIAVFKRAIDYAGAGYLAGGDPSALPGGQEKLALSNVLMAPGSSELCAQVEQQTLMDVRWGVFPYPGDGPGYGFAVESETLAVHKNSGNPQAAFDFIMLLTTGEFDQLYADLGRGIPADPANACAILGASELMEKAGTQGIGLLSSEDNELFSRLWNGWYKTAGYFANAMNGLKISYAPGVAEGVG